MGDEITQETVEKYAAQIAQEVLSERQETQQVMDDATEQVVQGMVQDLVKLMARFKEDVDVFTCPLTLGVYLLGACRPSHRFMIQRCTTRQLDKNSHVELDT